MSKELRVTTMLLAIFAVVSLLWVTWEMCRLSSWVVSADHVWSEMDRAGHRSSHYVAEAFNQVRGSIVWVEGFVGFVFLTVLWRGLFPVAKKRSSTSTPDSSSRVGEQDAPSNGG